MSRSDEVSAVPRRWRAALVFNPAAGSGGSMSNLELLCEKLASHFELRVFETDETHGGEECASDALAWGADLVIAVGGDGTVSAVGGALVGSRTPLGVLARGTSNSLASGLGIPVDEDDAIATLVGGVVSVVDTARANGHPMLLHASVGFHAATVAGTPRQAKSRWGVLAYVKEGLVNLTDLTPFDVEIETETEVVRCRAVNVTVANVAPVKTLLARGPADVSPTDATLDVTIVAATGLADAVATGIHLLRAATRGEPATRDNVGYLSARRLRIDTHPPQPLLIDGEPAGTGRLLVECLPRSLLILLPPNHDPTRTTPTANANENLEGLPALAVHSKSPRRRPS